ncbi:MAG: 6-carboxytetrahydropterin synthase [Phycisphaerales bacterium]|nr:6-carboxytetrahydropterin synthase [Phycisphaerales bacterium]
MVELTRTVRFCIAEHAAARASGTAGTEPAPAYNTFAGHPLMRGLGRYYEIDVLCRGDVDRRTGYFLNIKVIDDAVRSVCVPVIAQACRERPWVDPTVVLRELVGPLNACLDGAVAEVRWRITPYYAVSMEIDPANSSTPPSAATLTQQFDLAASHRLHVPGMSDAENRAVFGKCNHPSGHGHNYRVEPSVLVPVTPFGTPFTLADLERITSREIVDRFDHKHLNVDLPEFDPARGGLNPSVENIAKVFFDRLAPAIDAEGKGAKLTAMTVWETDKTRCRYTGG